jgi:hypothetical protein
MIRFLFRFLGLWILAAGFVFLVYDGTKSIAGGAVFVTELGQTWNELNTASLQALQATVESRLSAPFWQYVVEPILNQPTWVVLGVLGMLLMLLGRKKKPLIGYARR